MMSIDDIYWRTMPKSERHVLIDKLGIDIHLEETKMDVSNLTDQTKSVLLAKALAWSDPVYLTGPQLWVVYEHSGEIHSSPYRFNLYAPATMALAWRVLNWAVYKPSLNTPQFDENGFEVESLRFGFFRYEIWGEMPDAQRRWLDKILTLAIEAGLVELEEEKG